MFLKCRICGGDIEKNNTGVGVCPCCKSRVTLPKAQTDSETVLYNRALQFLLKLEYDKAYSAFKSMSEKNTTDPELYWGMMLSEYCVEYELDESVGKRRMVVNSSRRAAVTESTNYVKALKHATGEQKRLYMEEAAQINHFLEEGTNRRTERRTVDEDDYDDNYVEPEKTLKPENPNVKRSSAQKEEKGKLPRKIILSVVGVLAMVVLACVLCRFFVLKWLGVDDWSQINAMNDAPPIVENLPEPTETPEEIAAREAEEEAKRRHSAFETFLSKQTFIGGSEGYIDIGIGYDGNEPVHNYSNAPKGNIGCCIDDFDGDDEEELVIAGISDDYKLVVSIYEFSEEVQIKDYRVFDKEMLNADNLNLELFTYASDNSNYVVVYAYENYKYFAKKKMLDFNCLAYDGTNFIDKAKAEYTGNGKNEEFMAALDSVKIAAKWDELISDARQLSDYVRSERFLSINCETQAPSAGYVYPECSKVIYAGLALTGNVKKTVATPPEHTDETMYDPYTQVADYSDGNVYAPGNLNPQLPVNADGTKSTVTAVRVNGYVEAPVREPNEDEMDEDEDEDGEEDEDEESEEDDEDDENSEDEGGDKEEPEEPSPAEPDPEEPGNTSEVDEVIVDIDFSQDIPQE